MDTRLMILPARDYDKVRLVRIPPDYEAHEVFRHVTGIVARIEQANPDYRWEDVAGALEDQGFEIVDFLLGPALD